MIRRELLGAGSAAMLLAACAAVNPPAPPAAPVPPTAPLRNWSGRLSLQVRAQPPQSFSAAFELKGGAQAGELVLSTPLGSTLGVLSWSPEGASLKTGSELRRFASVDSLFEQVTGTAVPVAALFDWLDGRNTPAQGWEADLSQAAGGRYLARRVAPAPVAELRIVLDPPAR